ncbi:hypothetical protein [Sphaerisporangium fuscum]|uniref:hypothetical protein n=1 Tax=Sphaerisporangium fuscum TaxID=2835868 RepID=UPI001BDC3476|nr:hypothetical protein [Sphaerisporangium fuscum]
MPASDSSLPPPAVPREEQALDLIAQAATRMGVSRAGRPAAGAVTDTARGGARWGGTAVPVAEGRA